MRIGSIEVNDVYTLPTVGGEADDILKLGSGGLTLEWSESSPVGFDSKISVYKDSNTGLGDSYAKIAFNQEVFDVLNEYDNSSTYNFVATEAGYYLITAGISTVETTYEIKHLGIEIRVDNTNIARATNGRLNSSSNDDLGITISTIAYLNASSYVEIYARGFAASTVYAHGSDRKQFLSIHRLS